MRRGHHTSRVLEALGDTPRVAPALLTGDRNHDTADRIPEEDQA